MEASLQGRRPVRLRVGISERHAVDHVSQPRGTVRFRGGHDYGRVERETNVADRQNCCGRMRHEQACQFLDVVEQDVLAVAAVKDVLK